MRLGVDEQALLCEEWLVKVEYRHQKWLEKVVMFLQKWLVKVALPLTTPVYL